MRYLLALILLLAPSLVAAQDTYRGWTKTTVGATAPLTCNDGDIFINSTIITMQVCIAGAWRSPMPPITGNTGKFLKVNGDGPEWADPPSGGLPSGFITFVVTGTCPAGFSEVSALNGKTLIGTLAANGDVGTTGGSDTITEAINHTHAINITDTGHAHTQRHFPTATGGSTGNTIDTSMSGTQTNSGLSTASGTTGITASSVNPAGGVASIDNRSAFLRVIFCSKD